MPGEPANFTDQSVILVGGHSGIGKSTICSYLCKGRSNIKYICTDGLVAPRVVKKYRSNINSTIYNKSIKYLQKIKNPSQHIPTVTKSLDDDFFIQLITACIIKSFSKEYKCVVAEGFNLSDDIILRVNGKLKTKGYRVWVMDKYS